MSTTPAGTKANVMDSLQFMSEIMIWQKKLHDGQITESEFVDWLEKRTKEWGYIGDPKYLLRFQEDVKNLL